MNPEIMSFFGLTKSFKRLNFLETPQSKKLIQNIKATIDQGGIIALTGMVGIRKNFFYCVKLEMIFVKKKK